MAMCFGKPGNDKRPGRLPGPLVIGGQSRIERAEDYETARVGMTTERVDRQVRHHHRRIPANVRTDDHGRLSASRRQIIHSQ